ncbi:MAG: uroporphyrinogen decarboxylase [Phycisphaeraceae bacterium]|nr:uroporphyrinogen decarboxylase [Phycisphaeraceae bacterium]
MRDLVARHGGRAQSVPTMREIPLETNADAFEFADELARGEIDAVVLLTGVGTRMLVDAVATRQPREAFVAALGRTTLVVRGPKPVAALRELGLKPAVVAPAPNTWEDLLEALDEQYPVSGRHVAVQEYGRSNPQLIEALVSRGARVRRVTVYRWALPEDLGPLRSIIGQIIDGEVDVVLFTSATQADHLLEVAARDDRDAALRQALGGVCIGSIGPIATEALTGHGLRVDFEPDSLQMSHLVRQLARIAGYLVSKKRAARDRGIDTNRWRRVEMSWPSEQAADADPILLRACRREPVPRTPVWLMRQAGRYQREYHVLRRNLSMLELCRTPEVAAEVTLMAVERLGVDAAIIFSDLMVVAEPMGLGLDYVKGSGPVIAEPIRTRGDLDRLRPVGRGGLPYVSEAVRITRRALAPHLALIGFAGAPFTVASYLIEGGKSSRYQHTKMLMHRDPATWQALMEYLVTVLRDLLNDQIEAGADVVQLFDSWVGALGPDDYRRFVLPHLRALIDGVDRSAPLIHFATGNPALLPLMREAGGDVIGLDWRVDLADGWATLGPDVAVMGNLDPLILHATPAQIRSAVGAILDKAAGRPGHIFNLGHGILPTTPPEHVAEMIDAVAELSARP